MNPVKTEIKLAVTGEMGEQFDAMHEHAVKELHQTVGAKDALFLTVKKIQALSERVKEDRDAGKLPGEEPLKIVEYVNKYITRAALIVENLALRAQSMELINQGKVEMLGSVIKATQAKHDREAAILKGYQEAVAAGMVEDGEGIPTPRLSQNGVGPAQDIQNRREQARVAKMPRVKKPKAKTKPKATKTKAKAKPKN